MKSSSTCLIPASLCEGPFFYFYVESPPSTFMHLLREHSCLSIMCMVPKFIIDWFMIMVLLVLKLFVSSLPLKLEGVRCIYVLLLHEGQAKNHFAMFFYMLETHTWLSMPYYSWSFVCVNFHVITWLLSFIVKIMSFMPMFRVLWSQHSMLYIIWSRLCWCMSPKKLLFCYHLPTRGWAGVKLGNHLIKIFDAPCLFIHHLLCVLLHFVAFLCIFWN
jgi:hypothetical protein